MSSDTMVIVAMITGCAAFAGAVTFALVSLDLRGGARVAVSLISAFLVGTMSVFVLYLAVAVFLVVAVIYLVGRLILRPGLALAASGVALFCGFFCAVMLISIALSNM